MVIGVPRETDRYEHRVGLNPSAVSRLVQQGQSVIVERRAGEGAHFTDRRFENAGAQIVYSAEEVYQRADLVCRIGALDTAALEILKDGSTVCAFHHLAVAPREVIEELMRRKATLIGYEIIRDERGDLPVLRPFSEMAGRMAIHIAARALQVDAGGRGILLGSIAGVPPATVLVLGAGAVGRTAARQAAAGGAHVIVIDEDMQKLQGLHDDMRGLVATVPSTTERLERYTSIADVVVGAVLVPGARPPLLVTEEMVKAMKPGAVIIDISIDQGGCVETSRPTTLDNPTFVVHDVVHYCVPNLTANIARTASRALVNAALPYVEKLTGKGLDATLAADPGVSAGLYLYRGKMVNERLGQALDIPWTSIEGLSGEGRRS